jgi:hypothetical protein
LEVLGEACQKKLWQIHPVHPEVVGNGARRLRRFRVAQPCDVAVFAERQESADGEAA